MDQSLLPSVGLIALVIAMIITLYDMGTALRPATCPDCPHCQLLAETAAREQERLNRDYAKRVGLLDDEEDDRRID